VSRPPVPTASLSGAAGHETPILIIEHDLDLVVALAGHAYVLDRGQTTMKMRPSRGCPTSTTASG